MALVSLGQCVSAAGNGERYGLTHRCQRTAYSLDGQGRPVCSSHGGKTGNPESAHKARIARHARRVRQEMVRARELSEIGGSPYILRMVIRRAKAAHRKLRAAINASKAVSRG